MLGVFPSDLVRLDVFLGALLKGQCGGFLLSLGIGGSIADLYRIMTFDQLLSALGSLGSRLGQGDGMDSAESHLPSLAFKHVTEEPRLSACRPDLKI